MLVALIFCLAVAAVAAGVVLAKRRPAKAPARSNYFSHTFGTTDPIAPTEDETPAV